MSPVMSIVAASLHNDVEQMRVVAENMANADVVAYRQQIAAPQEEFSKLAATIAGAATPEVAAARAPAMGVTIDTRPGTVRSTGEPLNVAIQGDGYFVVSTSQGNLLTRRGEFQLDPSGILCAFSGDPVLGTSGVIRIKGGTPQISADGSIHVAGQVVGQLSIVEPAPGAALTSAGEGFIASSAGQVPAAANTRVLQGFLETSNVSPVSQMVMLMQATRHFEATQRFARAYDSMLESAINDLGTL